VVHSMARKSVVYPISVDLGGGGCIKNNKNICEEDMSIKNGHSHFMSMLLGSAGEAIPIRDGELCLGTWQRVLFLELDRERDRRWLVQVVGT